MSKSSKGNSILSESNVSVISSNTQVTNTTRGSRKPKDSILYASTIKEDITEYDHDGGDSYMQNSTISTSGKSEKKVKIVGQYKKAKSPSPGKTISMSPSKPVSHMFKKKRDSVRYSPGSTMSGTRRMRHSTSTPKNNLSQSFSVSGAGLSSRKRQPRSSSRKKLKKKEVVTVSFVGGKKLDNVPDVASMDQVLQQNSNAPETQDNTRSTILDIRTATFFYLFALAHKHQDRLNAGEGLGYEIEIKSYTQLRDSGTVKAILQDFNLAKYAKVERGAARVSNDGDRSSWLKIDYSWKLENPRYWVSILLKIAAFLAGSTIKQTSFNQSEIDKLNESLGLLDNMLTLDAHVPVAEIEKKLEEIEQSLMVTNYSIPDFKITHIKSTLISLLSCRIPKSCLLKVNLLLVKVFKLERNSESRQMISETTLGTIIAKLGNNASHIFTLICGNGIKIASVFNRESFYKSSDSQRVYKTSKSDFTVHEVASFCLKMDSPTQLYKRVTLTKHNYGASDELSELKDTINYCRGAEIKNIIVSGVFCYNGLNPTAVIDRAYIKFKTFRDVLAQAQLQGIKIIIEFETKIGTRYPSKKYRGRFVKVNHHGEVTHLKYGIGLSGKSDDMYCVNYADFENWKLTAGEIRYVLNKFKGLIGGICIKDVGLMPLIFQRDFQTLRRKELDGEWTYGEKLKKFGYIVNCDPYYYGSNFTKESENAFLKYLSTEVRNTVSNPEFSLFDDSTSIDQTGNQTFIRNLNSNGIHPLIRGISMTGESSNSLSNFQKNFELQKKWIKTGLNFTFVYDSTQALTKSTFANLMTILLGHSHCIYESNYRNSELTIVQCNTEVDGHTKLTMLRRIPRSNPVSEPEYVNQSRYLYIYGILNKILRESGKDNLNDLFAFNGKNLCERSIGFYSEKNTELIITNTTGGNRQVLINLSEVLKRVMKGNENKNHGSLYLRVKNHKTGIVDVYSLLEVMDNGLILEFGSFEVKHLSLYIDESDHEKMKAIEMSKRLVLYAIDKKLTLKNSFVFRAVFVDGKTDFNPNSKIELFDHFKNLVDRCSNFNFEKFFDVFSEIKFKPTLSKIFCTLILSSQTKILPPNFKKLGEVTFITPEYRGVSKAGGIAIMVADLCEQLALLGVKVSIITPYYHINKKGESNYLKTEYLFNTTIYLDSKYEFGIHKMELNGVTIYLVHNHSIFYKLYQPNDNRGTIVQIACVGKACMEVLCKLELAPSIVVGNDWFCAMQAAYAKYGHFGSFFKDTTFFHIFHNLGEDYEGRIYPPSADYYYQDIHGLPREVLIDPFWETPIINPSRAALYSCDQWATVSKTYKDEIMYISPLKQLLKRFPNPFGVSNGIERKNKRKKIIQLNRVKSKEFIQKTFFQFKELNKDLCLFGFIGRITEQKGVYFLLEVIEEVLREHKSFDMQFLVGGKIAAGDPYGEMCKAKMQYLKHQYPLLFWADAHFFFNKGMQLNRGADFGIVPSRFEPGGLVQLEFLVADTPVICAATGGLKDTVTDFRASQEDGNGFLFTPMEKWGLKTAIYEAYKAWKDRKTYIKLRQNCFPSVVDVKDMGVAYLKEFHRLKNSVYIAPFNEVEGAAKNTGTGFFIHLAREAIPDYEDGPVTVRMEIEDYAVANKMTYDLAERRWKFYFDTNKCQGKSVFKYYFVYMNKRLVSKTDMLGFGSDMELFNVYKFD